MRKLRLGLSNAAAVGAYFAWELALTFFCLVALVPIQRPALKLALLLALNIVVASLSATLLSFLHLNRPSLYLLIAAVFAVCSILLGRRHRHALVPRLDSVPQNPRITLLLWFVLGALLALSLRPIEDVDSLYNLHYMMGWVQNRTTPYQFAYNYVPFWELSSLPQLVLTGSDAFLWFNSLKPVLLLALALFLIGRELGLPDRLGLWVVPALLMFPHLWLGPSGVSTIKNDMIHAAGYALVALAAVRAARGVYGKVDVALAALAAVFVSVKFSGPVVMILGVAVIGIAARRWIAANPRSAGVALVTVLSVWFALAGHYYLRNFLVHGSPVYPYEINLGPSRLPGLADLSGTSILYNLGEPRLWRYLFLPEGGISPAGLLFPAALPAILIGSFALAALAIWNRRVTPITALALSQLVSWFVFLRSNYSASAGTEGDLIFIVNDLNSIRYVQGPLLAGELGLAWALHRLGVSRFVILALFGAHAASCFFVLQRRAPDHPWLLVVLCGLLLAALAKGMRGRILVPVAATTIAVSLFAGTLLVERRRPLWLTTLQPLFQPLYDAAPQDLFYLITDEYSQQPCWHFPLLGRRMQHTADSGSVELLRSRRVPPRFVAWTRPSPDATPPSLPGYVMVVSIDRGILLERRQVSALAGLVAARAARINKFGGRSLMPRTLDEAGRRFAASRHTWRRAKMGHEEKANE